MVKLIGCNYTYPLQCVTSSSISQVISNVFIMSCRAITYKLLSGQGLTTVSQYGSPPRKPEKQTQNGSAPSCEVCPQYAAQVNWLGRSVTVLQCYRHVKTVGMGNTGKTQETPESYIPIYKVVRLWGPGHSPCTISCPLEPCECQETLQIIHQIQVQIFLHSVCKMGPWESNKKIFLKENRPILPEAFLGPCTPRVKF